VGLTELESVTSTVSRWNSIARLLILLGAFTAFGGGKRLWERLSQRYRSVQRRRPSSLPCPFGIGRSA
jgi:ABC-type phosphate/phosphonate transport system permease subunit